MASKLDIWSQASIYVGNGPQNSLDANNAFCNAARVVYDTILEARIASTRWGFARKKSVLSKFTTTPLNEYQFEYQIPVGVLSIFKVYPNTDYRIYGDRIYSNADSLQLDYLENPGEGYFPAYFVDAMAVELAQSVAYSVTKDAKLTDAMMSIARKKWGTAWTLDAQQHPTEEIVDQPVIWARHA